jgi:hypothetical protein
MSSFSERYSDVTPAYDPAPVDLRDAILRFFAGFIGVRPLRQIVCRTAGRTPDAQLNWSDENAFLETRDICLQMDWRTFYDAVEGVIAGFSGRDRVVTGEEINKTFREYRMPWMVTLDGGVIAIPHAIDEWRLNVAATDASRAINTPFDAASSKVPDVPVEPPAVPAARNGPTPVPESLPTLVVGVLAAAAAFAAGADLPQSLRIWSGVACGILLLLAVAIGVHSYMASRGEEERFARLQRWLKPLLWAAGIFMVINGLGLQLRTPAVVRDSVQPTPTSVPSVPTTPTPIETGPRTLTLAQRNAIAAFARSHGRHTVFVLSADGSDMLVYADSLADAFEAGGWVVLGRRNDETRAVTHRLGALMPGEPAVAVAPDDGLGAAVKLALENIGLRPASWPRSLGPKSGDVSVWIGRAP